MRNGSAEAGPYFSFLVLDDDFKKITKLRNPAGNDTSKEKWAKVKER